MEPDEPPCLEFCAVYADELEITDIISNSIMDHIIDKAYDDYYCFIAERKRSYKEYLAESREYD